ncbi:TetR/AcrR family transcriptional regulator [Bacillus canaveralius]|uniref:TetR/AcrR family transcriptional regulator n=1 Tax=Bacillus canaveralius TaxID=1403243 RepID=UPI000F77376A|nr:TetR/AcrR family transcriptional regulator [Bacillus canaveralius]RSK54703.1 TetR/AcrR family transcriptional regulator [Bacillus canaveralius]
MADKFLKLDHEKRERIINAAINEFAQKGYENSSTNEIVKKAGISKGLLFHYFTNKKGLYLFLYGHLVDILMNEFVNVLDFHDRDIFTRIRNVIFHKAKLMNKYPDIFNFLLSAQLETSHEFKSALDDSEHALIQSTYAKLFDNIDTTRFKEGIDIDKAINMIMWTLEGFSNQELAKIQLANKDINDFTEAFAEADLYIKMLKKLLYQ